jgi:hypothetical protein
MVGTYDAKDGVPVPSGSSGSSGELRIVVDRLE